MSRKIRLVYSKDYAVDIGSHVFPTSKYNRIRSRLSEESSYRKFIEFVKPEPATDADILLVHHRSYLEKLKLGKLSKDELLKMEIPYSPEIVKASMVCCGGTILACDTALADRIGIHIGGGFHHAFPDHGEGFCVLNDIAVAIRRGIRDRRFKRALIVDCDLHQGNGTAAIFSQDKDVFTFSIHQENNYPFYKPPSSLDIGLRDRARDAEYLDAIEEHIPKIISDFKPDLLMYVAGADPYKDDRIGALSLTKEGLKKRDEFVFRQAINYSIPVAVVLAGGYATDEADTVDIHYNTIETGLEIYYGRIR